MPDRKPILVTGADGLLGRCLVRALVADWEVHALVHAPPTQVLPGVRYHVHDLGAPWAVEALPGRLDAIVHLAQSSHFREVPDKALDVFHVNVASTARLLDHAYRSGVKQFVYASSGGVYGAGNHAFNENSPIVAPGQLGYYLGSKLCGEVLVQSYAAHMQVLVLRFFFVYGPGQNRTMLIPRLIANVRGGRAITIQGHDGIRINPIFVSDAAQAVIGALGTRESATYNVAGAEILSLRDIADCIATAVGRAAELQVLDEPARDLVADTSAMRELLHAAQVDFARGIEGMIGSKNTSE